MQWISHKKNAKEKVIKGRPSGATPFCLLRMGVCADFQTTKALTIRYGIISYEFLELCKKPNTQHVPYTTVCPQCCLII